MNNIVMLGTNPDTRGGIAAVVNVYRAAGLFDRWPIVYLSTHRDGMLWGKVATAVSAWFRFLVLLAFGNIGLVYVHSASGPSFWRKSIFMLTAFLLRKPVVFHLHGGGFIRFYEQQCGPLRRLLVRRILCHARWIVVLSDSWRLWMNDLLWRCDVNVIANPVCAPESSHREVFPLVVLFLGRLSPEKGIDDLMHAFARLSHKYPEVQLICAGDGKRQEATELATALGIANTVSFPGWVEKAEKDKLLASAAVFVLPSHIEAMPMSLLEAMAWGVPVVAARIGSVPEVVTDGITGILVAPGNVGELAGGIELLLSRSEERARLGQAGREYVLREFGVHRVMGKMAAIFQRAGIAERT